LIVANMVTPPWRSSELKLRRFHPAQRAAARVDTTHRVCAGK
jgi:hypothetical protein